MEGLRNMPNIHHEQLALIYNNVSDAIFLIQVEEDDVFRCVNVNEAYLGGTGINRSEVINKTVNEVLAPEYAAFVISKYKEAMAFKDKITYEETVVLPRGKCIFEVSLIPIYEGEKCTHLLGISKDVTKRKLEEEQLIKSEKLAVVGQLAAGVAHEIRNPLTSIKGFLKLIETRIEHDEKTSSYFEIMTSELIRIEDIIKEFLLFAKPQVPKFELVDVTQLVNEIVQLLQTQAIMHGVDLITKIDSPLPPLRCDKNLMKQVLINIIQNSLDASSSGELIIIQVANIGQHIQFKIIDRGCGISEDRIEHLGEPFYSTKEKGTGLGLMICHQIIEKHQGEIHFRSSESNGTVVEVTLPLFNSSHL